MAHPRRLTEAKRPKEKTGVSMHEEIVTEAAEKIRTSLFEKSLAVLVSGNLPGSELLAAVRHFLQYLPADQISIYIPPTDVAILRAIGIDKANQASEKEIGDYQTIIAVGDVMGTHPVLSAKLIQCIEANPAKGIMNLDSLAGRTSRFSKTFLRAKSGREVDAVLALAQIAQAKLEKLMPDIPSTEELLSTSGLTQQEAEKCVEALTEEKKSLLILTIPPGRTGQAAVYAAAVCSLAKKTQSKLLPLYHYAGSPGAYAITQSLGLAKMSDWLQAARAEKHRTYLLVDVDPAGIIPDALFAETFGQAESLLVASPMPNLTTQQADVVLPLAFWFEMDGQILDPRGEIVPVSALRKPPGGANTVVNLINQLSGKAEMKFIAPDEADLGKLDVGKVAKEKMEKEELVLSQEDTENSYFVTSRSETLDLIDGSLSRQLDWPLGIEPIPAVLLHPDDAEKLSVRSKDVIQLNNGSTPCELSVRINSAVPAGTVAVPATIPETRNLFEWCSENGMLEVGPHAVKITVSK
jgi:anaerobic selenocysteine-containing dehydrogenase